MLFASASRRVDGVARHAVEVAYPSESGVCGLTASTCVVGRGDGVWVARGALDATSHGLRVASRDRREVNAIAAIVFNLNLKYINHN